MRDIVFAELTYEYSNFILVQLDCTPDQLEQGASEIIHFLQMDVFHKPVAIAARWKGKWMCAGEGHITGMVKHFNLDQVKWLRYKIEIDDTLNDGEINWSHNRR